MRALGERPIFDPAARGAIDGSDMTGAILALPDQLRLVADRVGTLPIPDGADAVDHVVVLGMGGSAMGADLVRSAFSDRLLVPLEIHRDASLPGSVEPRTLVIASSHSGRTEETLTAARAAIELGVPFVAVTTGGPLAELCRERDLPLVLFEAPGQPRAALGHGAGIVLALLGGAGLVGDVGVAQELREAAAAADHELAAAGPSAGASFSAAEPGENQALRIARACHDRLPVVIGSDHLATVARRWKTQLNENAKTWAVWDELPEANHNSVVGFGGPTWTTERLFVVVLATEDEPARTADRRKALTDTLTETSTPFELVSLPAGPRFAQSMAGVAVGDLVSLYVALLRGIDPTPVEAIERLKVRLAGGSIGG